MVTEITASDAWKLLQKNTNSVLIDVRTKEELEFVGFVDLSKIGTKSMSLPWRNYPGMTMNESFTDKLTSLISESFPKQQPDQINLLFLCRSGSRSFEAAMFMSDLGYNCYNITNGFEGKVNDLGHRGTINGWKAENLPWRQN